MSEFLDMGGYAVFVWSSYGLGAAAVIFNIFSARRRLRITLDGLRVRAARRRRKPDNGRSSA
jgi:heme exporter protein CcmD